MYHQHAWHVPHHSNMYSLHAWHVPLPYLTCNPTRPNIYPVIATCTPTLPDMYHHAWQVPPPSHAPPPCPHTLLPCLSYTLAMPCTPTMVTCTTSIPDTYPYYTLHEPPPCQHVATTMPDMYNYHAWLIPTTTLDICNHHPWCVPPLCLSCTATMPDMFTGALKIEFGSSCMWSELSADWGFSSAQLLSPRWPTEFI